jgi:subfamily B ATP-binding cassette protein MsbA
MEILGSVAIGVVIYIGGTEVKEGHMTVGAFFAFSAALFMLYTPIKRISNLYNQAQDAVVANERMFELLNSEPTIKSGKIELKEQITHLSILHTSLNYGDKIALNNVSVGIDRGETVALVGDSGAGKSSLVNLLVRFYDPHKGEIVVNETHNINKLTLESLHQKIAYVTQRIYIFNDTIAQNVAYGQEFSEERVKEALEKAYALEFIEELENGIHTMLTENGNNLSGGQRQRIALARAIYKKPDILILDEATSALDNKSEALIQKTLEALKHEMITITVAHRLSTIENSDAILVFKNGEILCRGQHQDLIKESAE